eukprot:scaffold5007_cov141-Skeletonema_menzelii.AAC.8
MSEAWASAYHSTILSRQKNVNLELSWTFFNTGFAFKYEVKKSKNKTQPSAMRKSPLLRQPTRTREVDHEQGVETPT